MRAALPLVTALALLLGACGPSKQDANTAGTNGPSRRAHGETPPVPPDSTKVTAFSVDIENLNVDKIAMRDGGIRPDGNRDLVFRATVEG
ncbi:MAG: hypothetical protein K0S65_4097, partial [Labilithrix sp.]|nr:hypothetical protein [Labilithrix sp.]